jgi:hypothetical protein
MYAVALAFSVICFLAVVVYFVRSPAFSLFHPLTFYAAFHGFIFVFRPIYAWLNDFQQIYRSYRFTPSAGDKLTVIFASNLGFIAFALCCLYAGNVAMTFKEDRFVRAERAQLKPLLLWVLAICVPIGLYSLAKVWGGAATTGIGYESMVLDKGTGVFTNAKNNGYLMEAQLMLASCGALLAWIFRFRLVAILPLAAFVLFRAGTGGRGPFVTAMVTVGLLYLYERRRRFPTLSVIALLIGVVTLFSAVGNDRGAAIRRSIGTESSSTVFYETRANERFLEGMDFANLEYFEFLVYAIPQRTGRYGYFVDTLQIFTEPVPRILWPNKPVGAPFNEISLLDYGNAIGMTRSLPGQGWYSLGWLGVIIWCGLWGLVLGRIYRRFAQGPQGTFHVAAYMIFLPVLIVAFRDGQLVTIFRQGLFFLGPVLIWLLLARGLGISSAKQVRLVLSRISDSTRSDSPRPAGAARLPAAVMRRRRMLADAATRGNA